jgi:hypothetical protein
MTFKLPIGICGLPLTVDEVEAGNGLGHDGVLCKAILTIAKAEILNLDKWRLFSVPKIKLESGFFFDDLQEISYGNSC